MPPGPHTHCALPGLIFCPGFPLIPDPLLRTSLLPIFRGICLSPKYEYGRLITPRSSISPGLLILWPTDGVKKNYLGWCRIARANLRPPFHRKRRVCFLPLIFKSGRPDVFWRFLWESPADRWRFTNSRFSCGLME